MYTFSQLCIGDMFNTKAARWVKISTGQAICVMGGFVPVGNVQTIDNDEPVIVLWSCILDV